MLFKPNKNKFTKDDITAGMAVKLGNDDICIAIPGQDDLLFVHIGDKYKNTLWCAMSLKETPELGKTDEDGYYIEEVYDKINSEGLILNENNIAWRRKLLWSRQK